jgi:hypothetical protein
LSRPLHTTSRSAYLLIDDGGMEWTAPDVSLPEVPLTGDDRPILEGFLAWHRALLRRKCAGLTGEQLAECAVPPSNLSLLGLVRHMAKVERRWFRERIAGQELEPMYAPPWVRMPTSRTSTRIAHRLTTSGLSRSAGWPTRRWLQRRTRTPSRRERASCQCATAGRHWDAIG